MEQIIRLMMNLIKSGISGTDVDCSALSDLNLEQTGKLFSLAKMHDVAPIVGYSIEKNRIEIDESIKAKFQKEQMLAIYRYEQQNFELEQITSTLENVEIDFIPLKGSVLRKYYPEPWMRTSCDIDVFIKEGDLDRAIAALTEKLEYKQDAKDSHDVCLYAPSNIHIELHYNLIEDDFMSKAYKPLKSVWNYTFLKEGRKYHRLFTSEMFYYYHIAHMAKHYVLGGCGVRPLLDLCVINNSMKIDNEKLNNLLVEGGLDKFKEQANSLADVWFGEIQHTELTAQMQDYILKAGVYGNKSNKVAVQQVKKGGKFKYAMSRIWLPCGKLIYRYPSLEKHKWLLPFYQVRRWFSLAFKGSFKSSMNELKLNNNISEEEKKATEDMIKKLGLE